VSLLDFSDVQGEFLDVLASNDPDRSYRFHLNNKIRLVETIAEFRPDVIIGIAQSPLNDRDMLSQLRQSGIRLCYWFTEDYLIFDYWKAIAPSFDFFFTIQQEPFWNELRKTGCTNFHYLPLAFDPNMDWKRADGAPEIDISFVGAPYPNRVNFFRQFSRNGFHIYGEGWSAHDNPHVAVGDRRIAADEARSIYDRTRININLHSSPYRNSFGRGDFVNPRTFELAGMGAFQLTDMRKLLTLHFNPAEEVIALSSWEDMSRAVDYFMAEEAERLELIRKAQQRVLREHTYKHRAAEIISLLQHSPMQRT
jgi:spore maturation protein CgeB